MSSIRPGQGTGSTSGADRTADQASATQPTGGQRPQSVLAEATRIQEGSDRTNAASTATTAAVSQPAPHPSDLDRLNGEVRRLQRVEARMLEEKRRADTAEARVSELSALEPQVRELADANRELQVKLQQAEAERDEAHQALLRASGVTTASEGDQSDQSGAGAGGGATAAVGTMGGGTLAGGGGATGASGGGPTTASTSNAAATGGGTVGMTGTTGGAGGTV